jgi:hypothetical protein
MHIVLFRSPSEDYWRWEKDTFTISCSLQWYVHFAEFSPPIWVIKYDIEYVLPPLGQLERAHNATRPQTALAEIAKSNTSNAHTQTDVLSPRQSSSSQLISPSHISGDNTQHNVKYLEQLLESSLATVAVIQFSGNTLADVLTPRAYDTFKALYALAALDTAAASESSTEPRGRDSEIPNQTTFSDIGSKPLPNIQVSWFLWIPTAWYIYWLGSLLTSMSVMFLSLVLFSFIVVF